MFGIQRHSKFHALLSSYIAGLVTEVDKTPGNERQLSSCNRCPGPPLDALVGDSRAATGRPRQLDGRPAVHAFLRARRGKTRSAVVALGRAWTLVASRPLRCPCFWWCMLLGAAFGIVSQVTASGSPGHLRGKGLAAGRHRHRSGGGITRPSGGGSTRSGRGRYIRGSVLHRLRKRSRSRSP